MSEADLNVIHQQIILICVASWIEQHRFVHTKARTSFTGLRGLLGAEIPVVTHASRNHALILATPRDPWIASMISEADLRDQGELQVLAHAASASVRAGR